MLREHQDTEPGFGSTLRPLKRAHLRCCHERRPTAASRDLPPELTEIIAGGGEGEIGGITLPLCIVIGDDSPATREFISLIRAGECRKGFYLSSDENEDIKAFSGTRTERRVITVPVSSRSTKTPLTERLNN